MPFTLRPFSPETDYPAVAGLLSQIFSEPVTEQHLREWDENVPEGGRIFQVVAVNEAGSVTGFGEAAYYPVFQEGWHWVTVVTDHAARNQGIGSALYARVEQHCREHGLVRMDTNVKEDDEASVAFGRRREFRVDRHTFESTLDLAAFDAARFAAEAVQAEASGIRFFTLADEPGEENERKLHALYAETAWDVPGFTLKAYPPFEEWRKDTLQCTGAFMDGVIIAVDGDRFAGATQLTRNPESGAMYTKYTCVSPAYRGRKIALALKVRSVEVAGRYGAAYMRTNNDSTNAPMLAVNRKLGYVPVPGKYRVCKEF